MSLSAAPLSLSPPAQPPDPFILLVDDHEPSLHRLRMLVESAGYECVTQSSPVEALALCNVRRPALVVTDLRMPRLDGRGLARGLKARHPALPILLLTGEVLDPSAPDGAETTFAAVLTKPVEVSTFLDVLGGLMPPAHPRSVPRP
jgi:CheY-like chemotaxis protein